MVTGDLLVEGVPECRDSAVVVGGTVRATGLHSEGMFVARAVEVSRAVLARGNDHVFRTDTLRTRALVTVDRATRGVIDAECVIETRGESPEALIAALGPVLREGRVDFALLLQRFGTSGQEASH